MTGQPSTAREAHTAGFLPVQPKPAGAQPRSTRRSSRGRSPGLTAASTGTPSQPEEPRPDPAAAWHQAWQLIAVMSELLDQNEANTLPLDQINNTVYTADLTTSSMTLRPCSRPRFCLT
jgi:hypothetical protein